MDDETAARINKLFGRLPRGPYRKVKVMNEPEVIQVKTVHCLHQGHALCGFGAALVPADWPKGHEWMSLEQWGPARRTPEQLGDWRLLHGARLCKVCNEQVKRRG